MNANVSKSQIGQAQAVPAAADAVVAPPYDVLDAAARDRLAARHERNVVRLDAPNAEPGDADDGDRYRRAARLLRSCYERSEGHQHPR